ncbi:MAG: nucleotide sugar dehydrogenase [Verrucomicrobiota bacterium]|nr:nucleotide sugar dehydrogenase [Verrucomicrobiota bacterium]
MFKKTILGIGAGYVGGPTMAVIAKHCPEYKVIVTDINAEKIAAWQSSELPIYEPGLADIVKKTLGQNLFFTTDMKNSIREADIIFVSVNTPTKTFGEGAGKAANLEYWEKTARTILEVSTSSKIIVEKSTLPVRTAQAMARILHSKDQKIHFEVLSNPEFLAEGTAISNMENPDRVLIGGKNTEEGKNAVNELVKLYNQWVKTEKILTVELWSAELSKLVANAFLAQRISSVNAISALCEKTEANITEISRAVGMDSRIGDKFLNASIGFGGSCFKKDILNLVYIAESYGLQEVADYWEQVVKINEYQQKRFVLKMLRNMFNTVAGKKIALFGFAFKANTGDTRESPAISVAKQLLDEHAEIVITDPKALDNARIDLKDCKGKISYEPDPVKATKGAHAIALMTEWDEYKKLDYKKIFDLVEKPAFIFDGRNILNHKKLYEIGFNVYPTGLPKLTHF